MSRSISIRKLILLIFTIILLLLPVHSALAKKNPQLDTAKELIREKKFTEAMDILLDELTEDDENEDEIMKLIDKINRAKTKQINDIDNILTKIKDGDTEDVQVLIDEIDKDIVDPDLVTELEKQSIIFEKKTRFEGYVSGAEEDIILGTLQSAFSKYKLAFEVYRADSEMIQNSLFKKLLRDYTELERDMARDEIGRNLLDTGGTDNLGYLNAAEETMKKYTASWQKRETQLSNLYYEFEKLPYDVKKVKEYEYKAILSITEKYIMLMRRSIEIYARSISNEYLDLTYSTIVQLEKGQNVIPLLKTMFKRLNNLEEFTNYRMAGNFSNSLLARRSTADVIYTLKYITRLNSYRVRMQLAQTNILLQNSTKRYNQSQTLKRQRKLNEAKKQLDSALSNKSQLQKDQKSLAAILSTYQLVKETKTYVKLFSNYDELNTAIDVLIHNMDSANIEISSLLYRANQLISDADDSYKQFITAFKKKQFENAKEKMEITKDKYVEVSEIIDTEDLRNRLDELANYKETIDQQIMNIELAEANRLIDDAKFNYYDDNYEEAKKNLDAADIIYLRYEWSREIINDWRKRIMTAIKIKSGNELTTDDPAYNEITELFVNARELLDIKDYKNAGQIIEQILNEKPYNRDARFLETLVLNNSDSAIAQRRYESYLTKAKTAFQSGRFGNALQEFTQLLQFGKDEATIKKYISKCRKELGFDKTTLNNEKKRLARDAVVKANKSYAADKLDEAERHALNALRNWDSVPGGREILTAIQKKTGKWKAPTLTYENELKKKAANNAYNESNWELCYQITLEILRSQNIDEIRQLNKKADIKRKSQ